MTSRSDQARLETVQQLLYHLRSERTGENEFLFKEVWESLPRAQYATVLDELDRVIAFLEEREKGLS